MYANSLLAQYVPPFISKNGSNTGELTFSTYVLERLNARKRLRSDATNESQTIVLNTITDRERNSETDPSSSVHYSESKARPRRQIRPFEIEVRTDTIAKIDDSETTVGSILLCIGSYL